MNNGSLATFTQHLLDGSCADCGGHAAATDRPANKVYMRSADNGFGYIVATTNVDMQPWQASIDLSPIVEMGKSYKITKSREGYYGAPVASGIFSGAAIQLAVPDDFEPYLVSPGDAAPPPPRRLLLR